MQSGQSLLYLTRRPSFVLSSHKIPGITHDSRMTFVKHFEDILHRCTKKILSFKDIGQQVGPKPHSHFTDLQIVRKTNIRIWNCFYNDGLRHCHQQTSEFKHLSLGEHFVCHNVSRPLIT